MAIKKIQAKSTREAMVLVKETFGSEAIILSNKEIPNGVELIVADGFYDHNNGNFPKEKPTNIAGSANLVVDLQSPNEVALKELRFEFAALRNLVQEQLSELI